MKTLRRALLLLMLLALPVLAQDGPAEPDRAAPKLQIYDVRDLVTTDMAIEELAKFIREAGGKDVVDVVPHGKGTLVIRATPSAQSRIQGVLSDLRIAASAVITIETRFIRVGRDHVLEELSLLDAPTPAYLDDEGVAALMTELERSDAAEAITAPVISAYAGQEANIVIGRQISYVKGFDVVKTEAGDEIADPVIDTLNGGMTLAVVAGEAFTEGAIDLDLDLKLVEIAEPMPTRKLRLGGKDGAAVEVQVPETTELRILRSLTIPEGKNALLSIGPLPFDENKGSKLLVLIKARKTLLEDD